MRILSRKIWRAFPELDRFDDETCERFVTRARSKAGSNRSALLVLSSWIVTIVLTAFLAEPMYWLGMNILWLFTEHVGVYMETLVELLVFTSFIANPWLVGLHVRDRWLHRSIRKQLRGALCKQCEYSLLGLEVVIDQCTWKYVLCPECGTKNEFEAGVLAPADIDPTLLKDSSSSV